MKELFLSTLITLFLMFLCLEESKASNIRVDNQQENCKYTLSDGTLVDLSPLRKNEDYAIQVNRYTYRANFCGAIHTLCPGSPPAAAIFIKNDICLTKLVSNWQHTGLIYADINNESHGLKVTFPEGDKCYFGLGNNQIAYVLKCNLYKEIEFQQVLKVQNCQYEFHFETKYGCKNLHYKALAFTSKKILIMCIVVFSLYCVGFSFRNYRENPEDGLMKAFPHREFWTSFVDNARQGVRIVIKFARERIKGKDVYDSYSTY